MSKLLRITVSAMLLLSLWGCSSNATNPDGDGGDAGAEAGGTAVTIVPSGVQLRPSQTKTFAVVVTGMANTAVTWSVLEANGGTVVGGLYTAPASTGTFHVVATSVADPTVSGSASVLVANAPTTNLIPADRRTVWSPGIPGGIPGRTTICATIDASTYGNGTVDAHDAIQSAIDDCPAGQVVYLPAGTYRLSAGLSMSTGITLRGAGPDETKLRLYNTNDWVVALWPNWPTWSSVANVTTDLAKGATQIPLSDASEFAVGDTIQIDQADDTYVNRGGVPYFSRYPGATDYGPSPASPRSVGQTVEVIAKSGNTITTSPQLHLAYSHALTPQVFKSTTQAKNVGLEDLYVTGGTVEQIMMQDCSYCWVKHVESDGTVSSSPASDGTLGQGNGMVGDHVLLMRTFRCEVRDSYFHHATHVVQGGGAYGISFADHSSDNLVENNIIYYMNKPLTMRASGGGNVVAYNYIDDAWTSADGTLMETTLDLGHSAFPYMELVEGNWSPSIATENVWGNSGWMTLLRNYASGQQQRTDTYETYEIAAISMEVKAMWMNVVGNVLGSSGPVGATQVPMVYEVTSNPPGQDTPAVFRLGHGVGAGDGTDDIATYENPSNTTSTRSMMLRLANWDNVRNQIDTKPAEILPDSLYLLGKPAFFGTRAWPWLDPMGSTPATRVNILPAHERFAAGTPNAVTP